MSHTRAGMIRRMAPLWVVLIVLVVVVGLAVAGAVQRSNQRRDDALKSAQIADCLRLNGMIRDYNYQYGLILRSLQAVQRDHPRDRVANAVIGAFLSPDFPLVSPIDCNAIRIY